MASSIIESLLTKSTLRAFRHRYFVIAELAGWLSGAGVWFYRIALQVLTWNLTHSGSWLGVIALAEAGPGILMAPISGALADRHDRLIMARIIQTAIMSVTAMLAVLTLLGLVDIWTLLVFAMLHGAAAGFWAPVRMVIMPNLVPREDLSAAIALHSTLFNLGRFLGPAVAAPILALWGPGAAFAVNAGFYLVYLVALHMVKLVNPDQRAAAGHSMITHLKEGIAYAVRHGAIKFLFVYMIVASVLMRAYMELLPGFSEMVFGYDPKKGVAILVSATGLGAICGSLIVGNLTRTTTVLKGFYACICCSLLFLTLFVTAPNFWFAVVFMAFLSASQVGVNISGQVMVQSTVRGELRGRVMSLWGLLNRSGPAVGALMLGSVSGWLGFRWPMLAAVGISSLVALFVASRWRTIIDVLTAERPPDGS